jgi:hypothetical protein
MGAAEELVPLKHVECLKTVAWKQGTNRKISELISKGKLPGWWCGSSVKSACLASVRPYTPKGTQLRIQ